MAEPLVESHVLEYPGGYTRSVGPVIGRFLTGLRDGRIEAVRLAEEGSFERAAGAERRELHGESADREVLAVGREAEKPGPTFVPASRGG